MNFLILFFNLLETHVVTRSKQWLILFSQERLDEIEQVSSS